MSIGVLLWRWGEGCSHVFQYHANLFSGLLISSLCVPQCFWKNLFAEAPYSVTVFFWNLPFKDSPWKHFPEPLAFNRGLTDGSIKELSRIIGNYSKPHWTITQKTVTLWRERSKTKTRFAKNVIKVDDSSRKGRKIFSFDFVYRLWLSSSQKYPKLKYGKQLQYNCFPPYP